MFHGSNFRLQTSKSVKEYTVQVTSDWSQPDFLPHRRPVALAFGLFSRMFHTHTSKFGLYLFVCLLMCFSLFFTSKVV